MRSWEHPWNIHAAAGFPSTFVNFRSVSETFRQHSIRPRDLPSTSINFLSVCGNILCGSWTFRLTSDNFLCGWGTCRQVFVLQLDLQSSSVNNPCGLGIYRQLSVHPWDPSPSFRASEVPSINFMYVRGRSINFRQLSVHPREYPSNFCESEEHCHLQKTFRVAMEPSIYFHQPFVRPCV